MNQDSAVCNAWQALFLLALLVAAVAYLENIL
jgi:hypothetical protein